MAAALAVALMAGQGAARRPAAAATAGAKGFLAPAAAELGCGDTVADAPPPSFPDEPRCGLFPDWRESPAALAIEPLYTGEVLSNTRGGLTTRQGARFGALLDVAVSADLTRLQSPLPGKAFLLAQNTHGRGITQGIVGDSLVVSDIDSLGNLTQVGEYWWEWTPSDGPLMLRLGKQDLNTEFVNIDAASTFIQASFELTPAAVVPSYPNQAMALVAVLQVASSLQLKLGAWDALAPKGGWGIAEDGALLGIAELEYKYLLGRDELPGTIGASIAHLGADEVDGEPFGAVTATAFQCEQVVVRLPRAGSDPMEIALFAAVYPRFRQAAVLTKAIGDSAVAGVVARGFLPSRSQDACGAGVSWAELSKGGTNQELVTELFYRLQHTPRIAWQPDLQYIASPSGLYRDALVAGVRLEVGGP